MSLCYDFQKWTMITLGLVAISLIVGIYQVNGASTNITGTYIDGKGIYKIDHMSVRTTSGDPHYKFLGSITNISNETITFTGLTIQMYDKNDKLIDVTGIYNNGTELGPGRSTIYKVFAPILDNEDFDHYVVGVGVSVYPSDIKSIPNNITNSEEEDLYDECVTIAGKSSCDSLFNKIK
jgi:hypothetical protein